MVHGLRSTLAYKGCGESVTGVDPSMIHCMEYIGIYRGCRETFPR